MGNKYEQLNNMVSDVKMKDIIIALSIFISIGLIAGITLPNKILNEYLLTQSIQLIAIVFPIYYLSHKFNLIIFHKISVKKLIKFSILGTICCLILNFPYGIWLGNINLQPKEYLYFKNHGIFSKSCFIIFLCVVFPIVEEILFRAYIYRSFRAKYGIFKAAVLSAFLFMLLHGQLNIINLFIPGLVYAIVYEKSGNIWSSILTHSMNNTLWFLFIYIGINR